MNVSGLVPGWHLQYVEVLDESDGQRYFFPCNQWLDKSTGDGLIERTIPVSKDPLAGIGESQ